MIRSLSSIHRRLLAVGNLLREPLVQFLLIGTGLFLLHNWLKPPRLASHDDLVVSEAEVINLATSFQRVWQRPPTSTELQGLIDDYIREEVLVREALALGLDRNDTIVRRRLRQKVEFLIEDEGDTSTPGKRELEKYFHKHADTYRSDSRLSFRQIFLDPIRQGSQLEITVERLLALLNQPGYSKDPSLLGDSLSLLDRHLIDVPQSEVVRLFGSEFAEQLLDQMPGGWRGPLKSAYGIHLVQVERIVPGELPSLAQVQQQVERDWREDRRKKLKEDGINRLVAKYSIKTPDLSSLITPDLGEEEP